MLVSLNFLPTQLSQSGATIDVRTGSASGTWELNWSDFQRSYIEQVPLTVRLREPEPPVPSMSKIKKASMKQEAKVAEALGGKRQPGSGAFAGLKGDGRVRGKYRIENKTRMTKSVSVTRDDLIKIRSECNPGEVPLYQIDFVNKQLQVEDQWIMVPFEHWKKMVEDASANDR